MAAIQKIFAQNTSSSNSVKTSVEDKTKNYGKFLVTVLFDTKKRFDNQEQENMLKSMSF